jgi:hypothetical protein
MLATGSPRLQFEVTSASDRGCVETRPDRRQGACVVDVGRPALVFRSKLAKRVWSVLGRPGGP